jgi:adenylate cyclase
MHFRIGINLGDVIIDGGDLYGDGVNVAARLQSLAEPDGIMVSGTVYGLAHKQLALAFDFVGDQDVKNLDEPVPAYRVRMADRNRPDPPAGAQEEAKGPAQAPVNQSGFAYVASQLDALWAWLTNQPRRVRVAAFMIAFFFAINLLFGGIAQPWFIFPAAPFALYIFLHVRRDQRRSFPHVRRGGRHERHEQHERHERHESDEWRERRERRLRGGDGTPN